MKLITSLKEFFLKNQSSGVLLILCVVLSLAIANSPMAEGFQALLDQEVGPYSVSMWINDALMAIFFLLVGLEIKREILKGELSDIRSASLPIVAAIGGMIVPAVIFSLLNYGTPYSKGWAIPMATDIAFSLAVISMLGRGVPIAIKVFLVALSIVDDLGAIVVIALFYTDAIHWSYLLYSGGIIAVLCLLNYLKVRKIVFYLLLGVLLWYCMHHSGIHATIAGVILAFTMPANAEKGKKSPLEKLEHALQIPVGYIIMPVFALANTNITYKSGMIEGLSSSLGVGVVLGLILGKLVGINLFSFIAVKLKISTLPHASRWIHMIGVGLLGGIGFTMSIFISLLSFKEHELQDAAKFAILTASILAGALGYILLRSVTKKENKSV